MINMIVYLFCNVVGFEVELLFYGVLCCLLFVLGLMFNFFFGNELEGGLVNVWLCCCDVG